MFLIKINSKALFAFSKEPRGGDLYFGVDITKIVLLPLDEPPYITLA